MVPAEKEFKQEMASNFGRIQKALNYLIILKKKQQLAIEHLLNIVKMYK
jgi:hypothetical protein